MAQYIDKDSLVAEIKTRISDIETSQKAGMMKKRDADKKILLFKSVLSLIDTIEVKEVDLEKVIEEYFKGWTDDYDNGGAACHYQYVQVNDCKAIAKYFFELGLKTQKRE